MKFKAAVKTLEDLRFLGINILIGKPCSSKEKAGAIVCKNMLTITWRNVLHVYS